MRWILSGYVALTQFFGNGSCTPECDVFVFYCQRAGFDEKYEGFVAITEMNFLSLQNAVG